MPRFVILEHDYPEIHWDFMLENGNELATWKLAECPKYSPFQSDADKLLELKAEVSFPHRLIYLDYEGPISNERGFVKHFDYGWFNWIEQNDKEILVNLQGKKLTGLVKLLIQDQQS